MNKLRALLVGVGMLVVSGTVYLVASPLPSTTRSDLVDAGVLSVCGPSLIECAIRLRDTCRNLPDGGLRPKYGTVQARALLCPRPNDGGDPAANPPPVLITKWPQDGQGNDCVELVGSADEACVFAEADAGCSDLAICPDDGGATRTQGAPDRCACRAAVGNCFVPNGVDGGLKQAPLGNTVYPPFAGAGCVRKPCVEVAGDQGSSWPPGCPP